MLKIRAQEPLGVGISTVARGAKWQGAVVPVQLCETIPAIVQCMVIVDHDAIERVGSAY